MAPRTRLLRVVQALIGELEVGPQNVRAQALRRLISHLYAVLEDRHRETRRRHRREPQPAPGPHAR